MVFDAFEEGEEYNEKRINEVAGLPRRSKIDSSIVLIPADVPSSIMIRTRPELDPYLDGFIVGSSEATLIGQMKQSKDGLAVSASGQRIIDNISKPVYVFVQTARQDPGFWLYGGKWRIDSYESNFQMWKELPEKDAYEVSKFTLMKFGSKPHRRIENDEESNLRPVVEGYESSLSTSATTLLKMYSGRCQICGRTILLPNGERFSEVYYLVPQGSPDFGPESKENMIVLCPNHKKEMQIGLFYVDSDSLAIVHSNVVDQNNGRTLFVHEEHNLQSELLNIHRKRFCGTWAAYDGELNEIADRKYADAFAQLEKDLGKTIQIVEGGENDKVEFKSSLRWNYLEEKKDNALQHLVAIAIAGFMNSSGGVLVIGVKDDGEILGLEPDYQELRKKDSDGFELQLTRAIEDYIGRVPRDLIRIRFEKIGEKEICLVWILPSSHPIYVTKEKRSDFPVRMQNSTVLLDPRDAIAYIRKRWPHIV